MSNELKIIEPKQAKLTELEIETIKPVHRQFAALVADGHTYDEAYQVALGNEAREPFRTRGAALARRPVIAMYIAYLRQINESQTVLSYVEKREYLKSIVLSEKTSIREKMEAIKIDNRMAGHLAPEELDVKQEGNVTVELHW